MSHFTQDFLTPCTHFWLFLIFFVRLQTSRPLRLVPKIPVHLLGLQLSVVHCCRDAFAAQLSQYHGGKSLLWCFELLLLRARRGVVLASFRTPLLIYILMLSRCFSAYASVVDEVKLLDSGAFKGAQVASLVRPA